MDSVLELLRDILEKRRLLIGSEYSNLHMLCDAIDNESEDKKKYRRLELFNYIEHLVWVYSSKTDKGI